MTKKDIDNIISIICPNDEDFEKPIISPAYLKKELEALALEQEPSNDMVSRGVFEQVMWERDVAIEQLKELGYELGEKICTTTAGEGEVMYYPQVEGVTPTVVSTEKEQEE